VQYQPWQHTPGLEIEYYGSFVTQSELAGLVQQAERVVAFSPQKRQMYVLAQRQPAITPSACLVSFDDRVCLAAAHTTLYDSLLQIGLTWQVTDTLSNNVTVFVHVADPDGKPVVQADGDLVGGLTPMASLSVMDMALYETRLLTVPAGDHRVLIGLYDRASGKRLAARCAPSTTCVRDAVQIP
jgi:hypothetical protein